MITGFNLPQMVLICSTLTFLNSSMAFGLNLKAKPNFLVMIADDMSPVVEPYINMNHPLYGQTPNIKGLAESGQTFLFSTSQQSICGPSRAALLTGRYPETMQIYNNQQYLQEISEEMQTIPRYFKEKHDYYTAAFGKVFHPHTLLRRDIYYERGHFSQETKGFFSDANRECQSFRNHMYCSVANKYAKYLSDAKIAKLVESFLEERAKEDQPWLALVGFRRPHLTNAAPESSYSKISKDVVGDYPFLKKTPDIEGSGSSFREKLAHYECRRINNKYIKKASKRGSGFIGDIETLLSRTEAVTLIRQGYYAAVHFLDIQVGKILQALETYGFKDNTVVIFTSDHGYQNGERNMWCKSTLYHTAAGVPFIISIPGLPQDTVSRSPTQLVDIFPTMIELLGEDPGQVSKVDPSGLRLDGVSMLPVILNKTKVHHAAMFSQYPRCVCDQQLLDLKMCPAASDYTNNPYAYESKTVQFHSCAEAFTNSVQMDENHCARPGIVYMGFSIRTAKWKYIEWRRFHEEQTICEAPQIKGFDFPSDPLHNPDERPNGGIECHRMSFARSKTFTLWNEEPIQKELYDVSNVNFFGQIDEEANNLLAPGRGEGRGSYDQVVNDLSRMIKLQYTEPKPICNNHGVLENNKCQCVDNWNQKFSCNTIAPGMQRREHKIEDWHQYLLDNVPTQKPTSINSCDTYSCPEHSHRIPGEECINKLKQCECDVGYKLAKQSERCLPCNTFICPKDSEIKAGVHCVKKFSHCDCNTGFEKNKKLEKCNVCNTYTCPEHSHIKPGLQCTKKFKHCKCDQQFEPNKDTEKCLPCTLPIICPAHSTPVPDKQCIRSFENCKCDSGYSKKYNKCVINNP